MRPQILECSIYDEDYTQYVRDNDYCLKLRRVTPTSEAFSKLAALTDVLNSKVILQKWLSVTEKDILGDLKELATMRCLADCGHYLSENAGISEKNPLPS